MSVSFSTSGFYGNAAKAMTSLTASAEKLQTQVSTGKRLQAPSDDSVAYQRLQTLKSTGASDATYTANVKIAQGVLAQADTTLGSIVTQLQQAGELATQAGNGTLSADAKKAIATQLSDVLQSVVGLGNTADSRGTPLFGGDGTDAAVTLAGGKLAFAQKQPSAIPIGDGQSVQPSVAASDLLKLKDGRDVAEVLTSMIAALNDGGMPSSDDTKDLSALSQQATQAQASVGARAVRVDLQATYYTNAASDRETERSALEDTDVTTAITELQKTMTILSATQASFSKLSSLSLFDYLR